MFQKKNKFFVNNKNLFGKSQNFVTILMSKLKWKELK